MSALVLGGVTSLISAGVSKISENKAASQQNAAKASSDMLSMMNANQAQQNAQRLQQEQANFKVQQENAYKAVQEQAAAKAEGDKRTLSGLYGNTGEFNNGLGYTSPLGDTTEAATGRRKVLG